MYSSYVGTKAVDEGDCAQVQAGRVGVDCTWAVGLQALLHHPQKDAQRRIERTSHIALTAHLVTTTPDVDSGALLNGAEEELHEHFEIRHVTLQLETPAYAASCALRPGLGCQA
ncbi:MAG: hypothetical protein KKB42_11800 [Gammaproteobacteria bacterium]|nr:hypothetical protein [Gammaproteobacteria bacterium]MBU4171838.1 hypothetical protein [Gammaproteobacteria bacterium]